MMPSLRSGKVMPGQALALPECYVSCNVYANSNVHDSATATDPRHDTTGAGAIYYMRRPSSAISHPTLLFAFFLHTFLPGDSPEHRNLESMCASL